MPPNLLPSNVDMTNQKSIRLIIPAATLALLGTLTCCVLPARADVKLPAMFMDHAVLQRDMPIPVWGWADPGDEVTVEIEGGQSQTINADGTGKWRVTLDPLKVGKPLTMVVTGGKSETGKTQMAITDVLAGEVWLWSG